MLWSVVFDLHISSDHGRNGGQSTTDRWNITVLADGLASISLCRISRNYDSRLQFHCEDSGAIGDARKKKDHARNAFAKREAPEKSFVRKQRFNMMNPSSNAAEKYLQDRTTTTALFQASM